MQGLAFNPCLQLSEPILNSHVGTSDGFVRAPNKEIKHGHTFPLFDALQSPEQLSVPDSIEHFAQVLKLCRAERNSSNAKLAYLNVCYNGLDSHSHLKDQLISMLVACEITSDAENVFKRFCHEDSTFWPYLLKGYFETQQYHRAQQLFTEFQYKHDYAYVEKHLIQSLLKSCTKLKWLQQGRFLHIRVIKQEIEKDIFIGSSLVEMYARCGQLSEARLVFDDLDDKDIAIWTVLCLGYAENGFHMDALYLLKEMEMQGMLCDAVTLICGLKVCAQTKALVQGQELHATVANLGYESDAFIGSALLDMYAKCGKLSEARSVFDKLIVKDVVVWTTLISGYADQGHVSAAIETYEHMLLEGVCPNSVTFMCALKACGSIASFETGQKLHAEVIKMGLEKDHIVGSVLIDMYVKCGALVEARVVFDVIPTKDAILWTALIAGYADYGHDQQILDCLQEMKRQRLRMDSYMFVHALKACAVSGCPTKGRRIHAEIIVEGVEHNSFIGSALIDMYAKSGFLTEACEVFNELQLRDVVSWTVLIAGYIEQTLYTEALIWFEKMLQEGILPNDVTFVCILKACMCLELFDEGFEVHAWIIRSGFESDTCVGNALVDYYSNCGQLSEAFYVFDHLEVQDLVSCNTLIAGCSEHGLSNEALQLFSKMRLDGMFPNDVTCVAALKACTTLAAKQQGQEIHILIAKVGLESDSFVVNTLIDMYSKCSMLFEASKVFENMDNKDVVSWNILIAAYAEHGLGEQGLACLQEMVEQGLKPDTNTFVYGLKCCGSTLSLGEGLELHAEITRIGYEIDSFTGSALIDMYARCGALAEAQYVFHLLQARDGTWNILIAGYTEYGFAIDVLDFFDKMLADGISPDSVTFVCFLKACGLVGAIERGREFHSLVIKQGFENDPYICNMLIDMYSKCAALSDAIDIFVKLENRDVISWTAIITGYARQGASEYIFPHLEEMLRSGVSADGIILMSVLSACSHSGLVDKGECVFETMISENDIDLNIEHYNCMIDLVSRAGQLDKAMSLLQKMPFEPNFVTWSILLNACRKLGNHTLGQEIFELALGSGDKLDAVCYLMYNIFAEEPLDECTY